MTAASYKVLGYLHFNDVVAVGDLLAVELHKGQHPALAPQLHLVLHILDKNNKGEAS